MHGSVDNVRRNLACLRVALKGTSARDIDDTLPVLATAMAGIQKIERSLAGGERADRGVQAALSALMCEIRLTQQLADQGLALYRGRALEIAALAGGYGATGRPTPAATGSTITMEG